MGLNTIFYQEMCNNVENVMNDRHNCDWLQYETGGWFHKRPCGIFYECQRDDTSWLAAELPQPSVMLSIEAGGPC